MYTYECESVRGESDLFGWEIEDYQSMIARRAQEGWRYVGFVPVKQSGHGVISKMDLIFDKEV